jgi:hypothetical protein
MVILTTEATWLQVVLVLVRLFPTSMRATIQILRFIHERNSAEPKERGFFPFNSITVAIMRRIIMRFHLAFILAALLAGAAQAQVVVHTSFNVDRQPIWGPTGHDYVEYYYLPDIETYYSVPQQRFFFFEKGQWISRSALPARHRGFDLYRSYKVVVNEPTPYRNHNAYKDKHASVKGRGDQQPIRDSRDEKYFVNKKHPEHGNWVKKHGNAKNPGK